MDFILLIIYLLMCLLQKWAGIIYNLTLKFQMGSYTLWPITMGLGSAGSHKESSPGKKEF